MKFATKIFFAIFLTTIFTCSVSGGILYCLFKKNMQKEYSSRYQSLGKIIGSTFNQMEGSANTINENADRILYEIEKNSGLPTDQDLDRLAKRLGIKAFYVTNENGTFIRSTDLPLRLQKNSLFSYCKDYKLLTKGNANLYRTPIIPGYPYNISMKLTMIPSHNRKLVLESGMELAYIGNILNQVIKDDSNIRSIGFYTPTGVELGYISGSGKYNRGRKNFSLNPSEFNFQNAVIKNNSMIFNVKIPSVDTYCCECIYKKVSGPDGNYYYILRIEVSLDPLAEKISFLRNRILLIIFLAGLFSIAISKILAKKLVNRIETINKTAAKIIESNDLDMRVDIKNKRDEIADLAKTFNSMIQGLKISQIHLVESEKNSALLNLAARVAHDIRSPLASMEANLHILTKDVSKEKLKMMNVAIQSVRDISNNLLEQYRTKQEDTVQAKNIKVERDDTNEERFVLLHSLIDQVISQKRYEWLNKPFKLTFDFSPESKSIWIKAAPAEIKRMISNLLNNAIEASNDKMAHIHLALSTLENFIELKITDNGTGIPENKIESYLNGLSSKHSGEGLGLSTAKNYMKSIGGQINIISTLDKGTTVSLKFIHSNPAWYPDQILLTENDNVIILDDDVAMQSLWLHRLENYPVKVHLFNQYNDAENWIKNNLDQHEKMILLVDYELSCDSENGLMLLKKYGLENDAYLVTSHAEEFSIQNEVDKLKVKLIPKSLVNEILIKFL